MHIKERAMGSYIPCNEEEKKDMLSAIGISDEQELFSDVPSKIRIGGLNLPQGKSELEVSREMKSLAAKNHVFSTIFRGAGAYRHYIPSIVGSVTNKEEFVTAYTPYEAEISQGVLQSIFEYQTMICELTDMDVSNASVYDGASAAAEASAMCLDRKRRMMLISETVHPMTLETVRTYCEGKQVSLKVIPAKDGLTDPDALKSALTTGTAGFYAEQPNYFGLIEDMEGLGAIVKAGGAKFIMGIRPIPAVLLKSPRECGADIVTGEGQPLGIPISFGGPYLGFMACRKELMRQLPGRIVGETQDAAGNRAFVLTLQAREQHIRREKASSNICSNQALCAMKAAVYMTAMGASGMAQAAENCYELAHYAADLISRIPGYGLCYEAPFFNEFLTKVPGDPEKLLKLLENEDILGGLPVDGGLLWCFTEMNTKEEIDRLAEILAAFGKEETK